MKIIRPEELKDNPFQTIGKDWMLVTAEKDGRVNMLTASWGALGILWNKPVATVYIRASRYTKEFIDGSGAFSLCVLPKEKKAAMEFCGSHSGRDCDKVAKTGLTAEHEDGVPYFAESRLVLICRKLYAQPFEPERFIDKELCRQNYGDNDFHTMYVAEITKILEK